MLHTLEPPTTCGGSEEVADQTYGVPQLGHEGRHMYSSPQKGTGATLANHPRNWRAQDTAFSSPNAQDAGDSVLEGRSQDNGAQVPVEMNGGLARSGGQALEPIGESSMTRQSIRPSDEAGSADTTRLGTEDHGPGTRHDRSQEWRAARVKQVFISGGDQPRRTNLSRSASLSEKELKEAKARSQEIAAHLTTPPSTNSRGVLLFNRRRQRVNNLTSGSHRVGPLGAIIGGGQGGQLQDGHSRYGREVNLNLRSEPKAELPPSVSSKPSGPLTPWKKMEEGETITATKETNGNMKHMQEDEGPEEESSPQETTALSSEESPVIEPEHLPSSDCFKESLILPSTNGEIDPDTNEVKSVPAVKTERSETPSKQYCEVHLTLSKPATVTNRTARPFGNRSPAKISVEEESRPVIDLPPPPTYAETLSSPQPAPHVRSPPSYSALYPTTAENRSPVPQGTSVAEIRRAPMPKSGVLEDAMARRGNKKSMFTFIEKPKLAPNPDLLSLVQNADEKRKQKEHGEAIPEEEHFALGAEASNFLNDNGLRGGTHPVSADIPPEWATCLKSPDVFSKPPLTPHQILPEAGGKGAELFARRQSRMEKYVIESPTHPEMLRSPSPTMSLPPSWKYATSAHGSPTTRPFNPTATSLQRSPKPTRVSQVPNNNTESEQSQKELQISKRQPYQLQSSLFILSPVKDPMSSLPRAAPPPKPMLYESKRFSRQSSCPTSPLPPSPYAQSPDPFRSMQPASTPSSSGEVRIRAQNTQMSSGAPLAATPMPPTSPVAFMHTRVPSPGARGTIQTPRPSFSTKTAGIESQERRVSPLASTTWTPRVLQHCMSLDERAESTQAPGTREGNMEAMRVMSPPPPRPMSPSWSERSLSPVRQELEPRASRQMQALIARNIINAARRKSSTSQVPELDGYRPFTPPLGARAQARSNSISTTPTTPPWSPRSVGSHSPIIRSPLQSPVSGMTRSPLRLYTTRSPTDSDISVDSEDSGAKSPGLRSYNICPRGWNGSLRIKRGSLPVEASCTT